jgi:hypothetical protein
MRDDRVEAGRRIVETLVAEAVRLPAAERQPFIDGELSATMAEMGAAAQSDPHLLAYVALLREWIGVALERADGVGGNA